MRRSRRAQPQRAPILARLALLGLILGLAPCAVAQSAITYIYDENGRLVAVIDPAANPASNVAIYRYDAVGNIIAIERTGAATVSILSFAPGCAAAGTTAVIYGTGFSTTPSQNTVTFNGTVATVTAATATQLTATIPAGASSGPIAVTAPGGAATSTRAFTVGCAPPTITGISPTLAAPGTAVVVDGTNFDPDPINDRLAINVLSGAINAVTSTRIDTAVPPNATSGRISLGTPYGTAVSTADLFVPPPGFTVADVSHTTRMPFPGSQTVSVSANKIALVVFEGVQGQRVSIQKTNDTIAGGEFLDLYPPLALAPFHLAGTFIDPFPLVGTGTFTLVLDPQQATGAGSITLTLYNVPQDPIYTATIDGPAVSVATTVAGQNADVLFSGTAGQRVSVRRTNNTYTSVELRVYGPDGTDLTGAEGANFIEPVALTVTGEQRLWVNPNSTVTGGLSATIYDVAPDVTGTLQINGAAVPVTLVDPGQNGSFTFATSAPNQQVTVRVTGNTFNSGTEGCLWIRLYKPGSVQVAFTLSCAASFNLAQQTLATVDTYTVVADPRFWNTGSLNLAVTTP